MALKIISIIVVLLTCYCYFLLSNSLLPPTYYCYRVPTFSFQSVNIHQLIIVIVSLLFPSNRSTSTNLLLLSCPYCFLPVGLLPPTYYCYRVPTFSFQSVYFHQLIIVIVSLLSPSSRSTSTNLLLLSCPYFLLPIGLLPPTYYCYRVPTFSFQSVYFHQLIIVIVSLLSPSNRSTSTNLLLLSCPYFLLPVVLLPPTYYCYRVPTFSFQSVYIHQLIIVIVSLLSPSSRSTSTNLLLLSCPYFLLPIGLLPPTYYCYRVPTFSFQSVYFHQLIIVIVSLLSPSNRSTSTNLLLLSCPYCFLPVGLLPPTYYCYRVPTFSFQSVYFHQLIIVIVSLLFPSSRLLPPTYYCYRVPTFSFQSVYIHQLIIVIVSLLSPSNRSTSTNLLLLSCPYCFHPVVYFHQLIIVIVSLLSPSNRSTSTNLLLLSCPYFLLPIGLHPPTYYCYRVPTFSFQSVYIHQLIIVIVSLLFPSSRSTSTNLLLLSCPYFLLPIGLHPPTYYCYRVPTFSFQSVYFHQLIIVIVSLLSPSSRSTSTNLLLLSCPYCFLPVGLLPPTYYCYRVPTVSFQSVYFHQLIIVIVSLLSPSSRSTSTNLLLLSCPYCFLPIGLHPPTYYCYRVPTFSFQSVYIHQLIIVIVSLLFPSSRLLPPTYYCYRVPTVSIQSSTSTNLLLLSCPYCFHPVVYFHQLIIVIVSLLSPSNRSTSTNLLLLSCPYFLLPVGLLPPTYYCYRVPTVSIQSSTSTNLLLLSCPYCFHPVVYFHQLIIVIVSLLFPSSRLLPPTYYCYRVPTFSFQSVYFHQLIIVIVSLLSPSSRSTSTNLLLLSCPYFLLPVVLLPPTYYCYRVPTFSFQSVYFNQLIIVIVSLLFPSSRSTSTNLLLLSCPYFLLPIGLLPPTYYCYRVPTFSFQSVYFHQLIIVIVSLLSPSSRLLPPTYYCYRVPTFSFQSVYFHQFIIVIVSLLSPSNRSTSTNLLLLSCPYFLLPVVYFHQLIIVIVSLLFPSSRSTSTNLLLLSCPCCFLPVGLLPPTYYCYRVPTVSFQSVYFHQLIIVIVSLLICGISF